MNDIITEMMSWSIRRGYMVPIIWSSRRGYMVPIIIWSIRREHMVLIILCKMSYFSFDSGLLVSGQFYQRLQSIKLWEDVLQTVARHQKLN